MLRKTIIILFVFAFCLPIMVSSICAFQPTSVVILPTYNTDKYFQDEEIISAMEYKLKRHFRYPFYELVTPENINNAMNSLDYNLKEKNPYDREYLKGISEKTCADIVVILHLKKAYSYTYIRGIRNPEYIQDTYVELYCYIYNDKDNYYNKFHTGKNTTDWPNIHSGLDYVLPELTDELVKKLPYKTIPDTK
ncbi:hypothetical protein LJC10_03170 [Selenomonadales bacterium OttesenSCG-928-I06]|nr:hypothetical protein [Selenomonadales bacterium OttesenSCG-928-I06]